MDMIEKTLDDMATKVARRRKTLRDSLNALLDERRAERIAAAAALVEAQGQARMLADTLRRANERAERAQAELDQISAVLDVLDGAPGRLITREGRYGPDTIELAPITRLSAFLAQRK